MTYDPEKPLWSLMTKTVGGTVSILRGLTYREACQAYDRLDPWYGHTTTTHVIHPDYITQENRMAGFGFSGDRFVNDGDIDIREIFGPEGWDGLAPGDVNSWPIRKYIYTDDKGEVLPAEMQDVDYTQEVLDSIDEQLGELESNWASEIQPWGVTHHDSEKTTSAPEYPQD